MTFVFPRGYIDGLVLSTAGSSSSFGVAVGQCTDSTNAAIINLSVALTKTTSSWAAGNAGAMDTGSIANSTWYHVHAISDATGQTVDVLVSLSASAPTMPSGYTLFRRVGAMKTNGSAQWIKFSQNGDEFLLDVNVQDVNVTNPGTSSALRTMTVPTGVRVNAIILAIGQSTTDARFVLSSPDVSDQVPSGSTLGAGIFSGSGATTVQGMQITNVRTNTSAQVRTRNNFSDAGTIIILSTAGWLDRRGRDS